jgi:hypothetical protein
MAKVAPLSHSKSKVILQRYLTVLISDGVAGSMRPRRDRLIAFGTWRCRHTSSLEIRAENANRGPAKCATSTCRSNILGRTHFKQVSMLLFLF